jgi:ribosome-binding protein aMBF1 (putative translation factor)
MNRRAVAVATQRSRRLETRGWKVGSAQEFLRLTDEEAAYIDLKLRLAGHLRERRQHRGLTQAELGRHLKSSQSRVAKMEAADPSVSLDLLIRSLLALGASNRELSRIISDRSPAPAA